MVRQSVACILCSAALRLRFAAFRCVIVAGSRLAVVASACGGDDALDIAEEADQTIGGCSRYVLFFGDGDIITGFELAVRQPPVNL